MPKGFFEGEDFAGGTFKALKPEYYPPAYKRYIAEEADLLRQALAGSGRVLEAGVGIGRLLPLLAPLAKEVVGVDNADLMLAQARAVATRYPNVTLVKGDMERLGTLFPAGHFDDSLCLWNTLGNVADETHVLHELARVTKRRIFVTVYRKGTLAQRKDWYATVGIPLARIDEKKEIFYTGSGLRSKSYDLADIERLGQAAGLAVVSSRILGGVILWAELARTTP